MSDGSRVIGPCGKLLTTVATRTGLTEEEEGELQELQVGLVERADSS